MPCVEFFGVIEVGPAEELCGVGIAVDVLPYLGGRYSVLGSERVVVTMNRLPALAPVVRPPPELWRNI